MTDELTSLVERSPSVTGIGEFIAPALFAAEGGRAAMLAGSSAGARAWC